MSYCQRSGAIRLLAMMGFVLLAALAASVPNAHAKICSLDELAQAVDEVGASLRSYNQEAMPQILAKMQSLQTRKGWAQQGLEKQTADYLFDARIAEFDQKANQKLSKIDALGPREDDTGPNTDCARIADLRAAGIELLAVMKAKTAYTVAKIDAELAPDPAPKQAKQKRHTTTPVKPKTAPAQVAVIKPTPRPAPQTGPWQTNLKRQPTPPPSQKGYDIDEIRNATRGFFGTISTNIATVLEHAFKVWGKPSAYVLGNEGGGAFLAGLRYGKGTLYLRAGGRRKVYWHGPSLGTDIGAAGSRTMFLIYNLDNADHLYRSYTGIDGSAYLVGGVGITFLKGGSTVMAPIRSGVGLRIGANLGYVRFTPTATWNPF